MILNICINGTDKGTQGSLSEFTMKEVREVLLTHLRDGSIQKDLDKLEKWDLGIL